MKEFIALLLILMASSGFAADQRAGEQKIWPKTKKEAVELILSELDEESIQRLKFESKEDMIQYHHGWGTGIRNSFGLWRGNEALLEDLGDKNMHPDDASGVIIKAVWQAI